MISRFRWALAVGCLALAGCGEAVTSGPLTYPVHPSLTQDESDNPILKGKPTLKGKPALQKAVRDQLADLFGPDPRHIKVPTGLNLPDHGKHLGNFFVPVSEPKAAPRPMVYRDSETGDMVRVDGGYALYRRHCLHCHGVGGDGAGPTAAFLWPRPRDYRPGVFKFTSTTTAKPTRDDLRKTLYQGIPNSSMPSFDGLMTHKEIEQVLDYVIFLSARGQAELNLINATAINEEPLDADMVQEAVQGIFDSWTAADEQVLNPPVPRTPSTPESIANGRSLFLGHQAAKGLQCVGCHGEKGDGNGKSFVDRQVFNYVTFGGDPDELYDRLNTYDEKTRDLWYTGSIDDWGNPLRAANLNLGIYKGGRRPLDIYWRIAKGINGAKMPAHASILKPEEIWDLVNFVLALPYQPELLPGPPPPPGSQPVPAVARR